MNSLRHYHRSQGRRRPCPAPARQRGAVLLLLVAVLGLGAASFLISMYHQPKGVLRQQALTQVALGQAREALLGYAMAHRRLPRPAISALDGRERPQPCTDAASCTGLLPWVTLGLTPGDGWNKLLRYSVSLDFANGNLDAPVEASKTVLDRFDDGSVFYRVGTDNCVVDDRCSPAVIFSSGRHLGVSVQGVVQSSAVRDNLDEQANEQALHDFMARAASDDVRSAGGSFSNMVSWIPLPQIRARIRATAAQTTLPR